MLRRVPRVLQVSVLATVILAVVASIFTSWTAGATGTGGYTQTQWGPLGPADRNLLVAVRLAGLWESPTGQQAVQQATRPEVRQVGSNLGVEHIELDAITRDYAARLGVALPASPTAQQVAWMNEITAATGTDYDRLFVQRIRYAHGVVLPVIAAVQVGTENMLVKEFAAIATEFVTRHIGYLESTGLVDYAELPDPPSPGLLSIERGPIDLIVPGLVVLAAILAAAGLLNAMKKKPKKAAKTAPAAGREPPVTGRAIAAIAMPEPRQATPTQSGAYQITERAGTGPVPRIADPQFVDGQFAEPRYADAQYADAQYADAQYADAQYADGQYADGRYADAQYPDGQFVDGQFADARYADARYPEPRYDGSGHPGSRHPGSRVHDTGPRHAAVRR